MKKTIGLFSILLTLAIASYASFSDYSYFYNTVTAKSVSTLPNPLKISAGITHNPSEANYRAEHWIPEQRATVPADRVVISNSWEIIDDVRIESVWTMDRSEYEAMKEAEWQESKSYMLKVIENTYIDFLTTVWTTALRNAGLIAIDYTITVDNTTEEQNINYLLQLRSLNFDDYNTCASEFSRFKSTILENGGVMAKVQLPDL